MAPAYSVIFFTTASGAGYGLLVWLVLATLLRGAPSGQFAFALVFGTAMTLIGAGLLASLVHLGHPERAWRAVSQWRSSWLSREGVLALASFVPALAFAGLRFFPSPAAAQAAGAASLVLAIATVAATGMIYASLRPVPRWHNRWVVPGYVGFALATGALWLQPVLVWDGLPAFGWIAALVWAGAWFVKWLYWRETDHAAPVSTVGSALGLGAEHSARVLDPPGTAGNFVCEEMGYRVARKHAARLRRIALALAAASAGSSVAIPFAGAGIGLTCAIVALATGMGAVLIERWLFFAEARHLVTLYFGANAV